MKNILLFLFSIGIGVFIMIAYARLSKIKQTNITISPIAKLPFSLVNAPSLSVKGHVTSLSGSVNWQSRIATQAAKLQTKRDLQQGEVITTDDGSITIQFPKAVTISLEPKSEVHVVQTLPDNIVFAQAQGFVSYTKTGTIPISVRVLHLLIEQQNGIMVVSHDKDSSTVAVTIASGSATMAYNNRYAVSTVVKVNEGSTFLFEEETKSGRIE